MRARNENTAVARPAYTIYDFWRGAAPFGAETSTCDVDHDIGEAVPKACGGGRVDTEGGGEGVGERGIRGDDTHDSSSRDGGPGARIDDVGVTRAFVLDVLEGGTGGRDRGVRERCGARGEVGCSAGY